MSQLTRYLTVGAGQAEASAAPDAAPNAALDATPALADRRNTTCRHSAEPAPAPTGGLIRCPHCGWRGVALFGHFPVHQVPAPELTPAALLQQRSNDHE